MRLCKSKEDCLNFSAHALGRFKENYIKETGILSNELQHDIMLAKLIPDFALIISTLDAKDIRRNTVKLANEIVTNEINIGKKATGWFKL